jgi:subtilisin-like proprotein convertase family protein
MEGKVMKSKKLSLVMALVLGVVFGACGGDDGINTTTMTKAEAEVQAQTFDTADWGYDVCEQNGWYNDEVCDTFCPLPDPDCSVCVEDADCEHGREWCEEGECVPCSNAGRHCTLYCEHGFVSRNGCTPCVCAEPARDDRCDDGTTPVCAMMPPDCPDGTILAYVSHCYECVDPETCQVVPLRDDRCDDGTDPMCAMMPPDCPDGTILAYVSHCYECVDPETCQVVPLRDDRCDDGTVPVCTMMPPDCPDGTILAYVNHCFACLDPETCRPVANQMDFTNNQKVDIPDADPAGITSTIEVGVMTTGQAFHADVSVDIRIGHTYASDLVVGLTDPSGNRVVLWDREGGSQQDLILSSVIMTDQPMHLFNGIWTLDISDLAQVDTGTLENWSINLTIR